MPIKPENKARYPLFSNGAEFMMWQERNCEKCFKAVWYNEKTGSYPKYRCAIQEHIEMAAVGDGCGNKRDYKATNSYHCPHAIRSRIPRVKKQTRHQLDLFENDTRGT